MRHPVFLYYQCAGTKKKTKQGDLNGSRRRLFSCFVLLTPLSLLFDSHFAQFCKIVIAAEHAELNSIDISGWFILLEINFSFFSAIHMFFLLLITPTSLRHRYSERRTLSTIFSIFFRRSSCLCVVI